MSTVIIDYGSGNLRSAEKAFQRAAQDQNGASISVTSNAKDVRGADRVVLPGVGAFADCRAGLLALEGMEQAIQEHVQSGKPFFGICVGMQLMATRGLEFGETSGFDWIPGSVEKIEPNEADLKIPHMGWNAIQIDAPHPVLNGINDGDHVYFVHSYHLHPQKPEHRLASAEYGGPITAMVGRDAMIGTQFHPEKSQDVGLRLISNFLNWKP